MTQQQIKDIQTKIGVAPDGFWGPKSIAACQRHLRRLMPKPNPWPKADQKSLTAAFGPPGDSKLINLDVTGLGVRFAGRPVKTIRCNARVSASLRRVLESLAKTHPYILARFDGCYDYRFMRGGSLPSLHARGAAIDFDAANNGLHMAWPTRATMPFEVMEAFAREGWLAAGAFWSRDAMHFQATQ